MKKQLVLAAGLAVLAAPAFASKARLQALGEDTNGSFYINDNRNIFLNASNVNMHKDLVTYEWGDAAANDATATPRAEGGFFRSTGNLVYGAQLGRQSRFEDLANDASNSTALPLDSGNNLELFVGGDAGIKWGAALSYVGDEDETGATKKEHKSMDLALGVSQNNWTAFANIGLVGENNNKTVTEVERKSDIDLGGSYMLNDYTIFARYAMAKLETKGAAEKYESKDLSVGVGRSTKLNDKATLFTRVSYESSESNPGTNYTTFTAKDAKNTGLPVVAGLEFDAASWLTLRGSVGQQIWSSNKDANGKKSTAANSTIVNAGASLKFGDLMVDGVIGNNNTGANGGIGDSTANGSGQLRTDSLMSRVSVTYRF